MDQTIVCILLLLHFSAAPGKYVYVKKGQTWHDARTYCQKLYTDLAPVSSKHGICLLLQLTSDRVSCVWIGFGRLCIRKLIRLGIGKVITSFRAPGQPECRLKEDYSVTHAYTWHDSKFHILNAAFCYRVFVVKEKKKWEEALDYCRERHRDLASVASETEMILIRRELEKEAITGRVWIGLRFFPGRWLWVDGQPLDYEAWGQGNKPACPKVNLECAALEGMAGTKSSSSADPALGTDAKVGKRAVHNNVKGSVMDFAGKIGENVSRVSEAAADCIKSVWEAHDCEESLPFICY